MQIRAFATGLITQRSFESERKRIVWIPTAAHTVRCPPGDSKVLLLSDLGFEACQSCLTAEPEILEEDKESSDERSSHV